MKYLMSMKYLMPIVYKTKFAKPCEIHSESSWHELMKLMIYNKCDLHPSFNHLLQSDGGTFQPWRRSLGRHKTLQKTPCTPRRRCFVVVPSRNIVQLMHNDHRNNDVHTHLKRLKRWTLYRSIRPIFAEAYGRWWRIPKFKWTKQLL